MPSTFSNLKFELIGTGDQAGTWGATTNTNIGTAIEQAIVGKATVPSGLFTANVATLTLTDTNALQEARAFVLDITATLSAAGTINVPAISKPYIILNNSVGGFAVTVKVSGQTGVSVPNGKRAFLYNNGTDVGVSLDYLPSLSLGTDLAITEGGTGASTASGARTNLGATTLGGNMFTLTNPSAVTFPRFNADNTVSALDAATFRTAIGAGTGSGSVTGVTATAPVASSGGTAPDISLSANYGDTQNPYASKTQNFFLAAPNGAAGVPTFRAIVAADIPTLNQNTTGSAASATTATTATTATNLAGGAANRVAFQSGVGATGFIAAPSLANSFLTWDGTNFGWSTTTYGTIPVTSGGTGKTSWTSGTLPYNNGTTSFASSGINYDGTNMGLNYAAEAWSGTYSVFRVGQTGHFFQDGGTTFGTTYVVNNAYFNGTNWVRNYASNAPTSYRSYGGAHIFGYAASGAAGSTFGSFTDVATIDSSGITLAVGNFVGNASTATSIAGGAANQIHYQTGAGATSFIAAPTTASTYLSWNGSGFAWAAAGGGGSPAGSNTQVQFNNSGSFGASANLTFDGTNLTCAGSFISSSDARLKTNWRDLSPTFIEDLANVKVGVYDRTDTGSTQVGVSAQSLQAVLEQAVSADSEGMLSVAYGNAALVAAVKLAEKVVALEAKLAALEAKLNKE